MDAVINHTGPVTPLDPAWPDDWVRTGPRCAFRDYATTVECTLVDNLPDILTHRDEPVDLPDFLREKWRTEGRLADEIAELDGFFRRTGYPRAPRYYVMKWLTDWVREVGFDGYRVDTAKHFPEGLSAELKREASHAYADWREANPQEVLDDLPFFFLGEVYNYDLAHGRDFDFGDRTVDFFDHGYDALINFGFKRDAGGPLEAMFVRYSSELREGQLLGLSVVNYVSSHDDGDPFDPRREHPMGAGTRLLLAPGGAQIYYGDEIARPLSVAGAQGDANLRSMMPWETLEAGPDATSAGALAVLGHWRTLGRFRKNHPAVGAGEHVLLQTDPYVFARTLRSGPATDRVVVALGHEPGTKTIPVAGVFPDGTELEDAYSGRRATVSGGVIVVDTPFALVLLGEAG
jgi:alpha-amylase